MLNTILVPLDGSDLAARALPYAVALARPSGARLILVRATPVRTLTSAEAATAQIAAHDQLEAELGEVAAELRREALEAESYVYYGQAAPAILDAAGAKQVDLIVMSTHGRSGLGRLVFGSVADQVLREAKVPVLLIPAACQQSEPAGRQPRVLVALDGSELSEEVLGPAGRLAATLNAELVLLRVTPPPDPRAYGDGYGQPAASPDAAANQASNYLEELATLLRGEGRTVSTVAASGSPAETIATVARERGVDLIAMATHGRGGLARLVLGSVATATLHLASVPLLLARPAALEANGSLAASGSNGDKA